MSAADLQASGADSQLRVGTRLRQNFLDLITVKPCIMESKFGCFEVPENISAHFRSNCSKTSAKVFISLVISSNVEW